MPSTQLYKTMEKLIEPPICHTLPTSEPRDKCYLKANISFDRQLMSPIGILSAAPGPMSLSANDRRDAGVYAGGSLRIRAQTLIREYRHHHRSSSSSSGSSSLADTHNAGTGTKAFPAFHIHFDVIVHAGKAMKNQLHSDKFNERTTPVALVLSKILDMLAIVITAIAILTTILAFDHCFAREDVLEQHNDLSLISIFTVVESSTNCSTKMNRLDRECEFRWATSTNNPHAIEQFDCSPATDSILNIRADCDSVLDSDHFIVQLIVFQKGKPACEPPQSRRSPPPMNSRNLDEGTGSFLEDPLLTIDRGHR
ncbi:hypothetical protein EVAR_35815_1 [Eumeta japonica]|uniref:Uncharacterized protein n=1 Tax=Eumeta variegata TaxID=151549 RepID=A0A4C1WW58_EUMVA|nr:hypothetical protein EVAR_35815_1 [Eumeta japonica]